MIAGGDAAIRRAQEGAEDRVSAGEADIIALGLRPELDSVIGIAASGRTPYVLGALAATKREGCLTLGVACTSPSAMSLSGNVDFMISPLPGPEVVTGSTRLKAGTATKLVLNMLSTGVMIRIGKTYGNLVGLSSHLQGFGCRLNRFSVYLSRWWIWWHQMKSSSNGRGTYSVD